MQMPPDAAKMLLDGAPEGVWRGRSVTNLDLARLQFASTSIYHFLFVPVTIGLAFLVALLQTTWHRRGDEAYLRLTRFFGTLLVINIAIGVVTGLVQEFQFGMNWSAYSRYVGDVFGAPLAIEGLGAFFLESVFLGLWLFGWGRLSPRVHLATIWAVAGGAALSAAFIMAANSWMQHPVGSAVMLAVSAWHRKHESQTDQFRKTASLSLSVLLPASMFAMMVGSHLGVI